MAGPVLIIGASHTQGTNGDLTGSSADNYAPHGYWAGRLPAGSMVYGVSGYTIENMMDLWLVPNFVTPNVNVLPTVVVLLGHNNGANGSSTPATPGGTCEMNYLVDLLRGRGATRILAITCTADTTAHSVGYDFYSNNFVTWNSQQVANSLVKGYEIIDYKMAFFGPNAGPVLHPEYFIADGVHHTAAGKQAYVDLVVAAINAVPPANSWVGSKALSGSQVVTPSATTIYTLTATNAAGSVASSQTITVGSTPGWTLVWADEFDGPVNTRPDDQNVRGAIGAAWTLDDVKDDNTSGNSFWLEKNVYLDGNGACVIRGLYENYVRPSTGVTYPYTAGSVHTEPYDFGPGFVGGKEWKYGAFEFRAKGPIVPGTWWGPWMEGSAKRQWVNGVKNWASNIWPLNGEVDVMEWAYGHQSANYATNNILHPTAGWGGGYVYTVPMPSGGSIADWHVYRFEWSATEMNYYIDPATNPTPTTTIPHAAWMDANINNGPYVGKTYDLPFFVRLHLHLGGNAGTPNPANFPVYVYYDYVRVYQRT